MQPQPHQTAFDLWAFLAHWQVISAAAVAAVALGGLVWRYLRKPAEALGQVFKRPADNQLLLERIKLIADQLIPDSGNSFRDVIDRVDVNVAQTAARLLSSLEESDRCMWEADVGGAWTWANSAFLRLAERPLSDVLGYGWSNTIHIADRDRVVLDWGKAVKELRNFEESFRLLTPRGTEHNVAVVARAFKTLGATGKERVSWIAYLRILN
jgi:PAS domain-containing protein